MMNAALRSVSRVISYIILLAAERRGWAMRRLPTSIKRGAAALAVLLTACSPLVQQAAQAPAPTVAPVPTPLPTSAPSPSLTQAPAPTRAPTPTPPTSTPTSTAVPLTPTPTLAPLAIEERGQIFDQIWT